MIEITTVLLLLLLSIMIMIVKIGSKCIRNMMRVRACQCVIPGSNDHYVKSNDNDDKIIIVIRKI